MNDSWSNLGSEAKNKGLSIEVLCFLFVSVGNKTDITHWANGLTFWVCCYNINSG